ncbi:hypothetical protein VP01_1685g4 [Puccinia sorghi]|uniref:Uncharacterized protein n=1 Tax=Puccinia sorghi TaxID=27349 RepID=A0A0L6VHS0_9BASI|nr:hypothetical protein VP01_1685g4 [Puccinia sorghi]
MQTMKSGVESLWEMVESNGRINVGRNLVVTSVAAGAIHTRLRSLRISGMGSGGLSGKADAVETELGHQLQRGEGVSRIQVAGMIAGGGVGLWLGVWDFLYLSIIYLNRQKRVFVRISTLSFVNLFPCLSFLDLAGIITIQKNLSGLIKIKIFVFLFKLLSNFFFNHNLDSFYSDYLFRLVTSKSNHWFFSLFFLHLFRWSILSLRLTLWECGNQLQRGVGRSGGVVGSTEESFFGISTLSFINLFPCLSFLDLTGIITIQKKCVEYFAVISNEHHFLSVMYFYVFSELKIFSQLFFYSKFLSNFLFNHNLASLYSDYLFRLVTSKSNHWFFSLFFLHHPEPIRVKEINTSLKVEYSESLSECYSKERCRKKNCSVNKLLVLLCWFRFLFFFFCQKLNHTEFHLTSDSSLPQKSIRNWKTYFNTRGKDPQHATHYQTFSLKILKPTQPLTALPISNKERYMKPQYQLIINTCSKAERNCYDLARGLQCPVVLEPPGDMCQECLLPELRILHSGKKGMTPHPAIYILRQEHPLTRIPEPEPLPADQTPPDSAPANHCPPTPTRSRTNNPLSPANPTQAPSPHLPHPQPPLNPLNPATT